MSSQSERGWIKPLNITSSCCCWRWKNWGRQWHPSLKCSPYPALAVLASVLIPQLQPVNLQDAGIGDGSTFSGISRGCFTPLWNLQIAVDTMTILLWKYHTAVLHFKHSLKSTKVIRRLCDYGLQYSLFVSGFLHSGQKGNSFRLVPKGVECYEVGKWYQSIILASYVC